jgi:hypothetical protein
VNVRERSEGVGMGDEIEQKRKRRKGEVGGEHIERVKKRQERKPAALSANSVWFRFTCPPHYSKLKPAKGEREGATGIGVTPHITRPTR